MDLKDKRQDLGLTGSWRFQKSIPGRKEDLGSNAAEKDQSQEKVIRFFSEEITVGFQQKCFSSGYCNKIAQTG